jgi:hypothetical protein
MTDIEDLMNQALKDEIELVLTQMRILQEKLDILSSSSCETYDPLQIIRLGLRAQVKFLTRRKIK